MTTKRQRNARTKGKGKRKAAPERRTIAQLERGELREPGHAGRPSRLTEALAHELEKHLTNGHFREVAVEACGLGFRTFREWMARGRAEPDGPYGEFRRRMIKAERTAELLALGVVTKAAAGGDVKAATWYLARKFPKRWGFKQAVELSGDPKKPVKVQQETADRVAEALAKLAAAIPGAPGGPPDPRDEEAEEGPQEPAGEAIGPGEAPTPGAG